mmetsp:Transcript_17140/g.28194  ORF Transcript_17140/g.28194 Transcript_17140/m.28194 type:complete len:377 (-) Transcript_17140:345-1475(-)
MQYLFGSLLHVNLNALFHVRKGFIGGDQGRFPLGKCGWNASKRKGLFPRKPCFHSFEAQKGFVLIAEGEAFQPPIRKRQRAAQKKWLGRPPRPGKILALARPDIALEWNLVLNDPIRPDQVEVGSKFQAWWTCFRDVYHIWQASVFNRTQEGTGCPWCVNRLVSPENSFAALHPEIAREFDSKKNAPYTADGVPPSSIKRFWWQCTADPEHVWQASISNRVSRQSGCPVCRKSLHPRGTSFWIARPGLENEFHPSLNAGVDMNSLTFGSTISVWWRCKLNSSHEWEAKVSARVRGGGCPYCAGKRASPARNLALLYPDVAAEWHPTKNEVTPDRVLPISSLRYWFICNTCSHEWCTSLRARTRLKSGCPRCARDKS